MFDETAIVFISIGVDNAFHVGYYSAVINNTHALCPVMSRLGF